MNFVRLRFDRIEFSIFFHYRIDNITINYVHMTILKQMT